MLQNMSAQKGDAAILGGDVMMSSIFQKICFSFGVVNPF